MMGDVGKRAERVDAAADPGGAVGLVQRHRAIAQRQAGAGIVVGATAQSGASAAIGLVLDQETAG